MSVDWVSGRICFGRGVSLIVGRLRRPALALLPLALAGIAIPPATALASSGWSAPLGIMGHNLRPGSGLTSVSCPSASFCVAEGIVNFYAYEPQKSYLVAVGYNHGSWSAPAKLNAGPAAPIAVSCFSVSFCLALGGGAQALTYNGRSWSAPTTIDPDSGLHSVSCPSTSFCVAVDGLGNALSYAAAATPTGGYERRPSLRVEPHAVRAGGHVLVSGFIGRVRGQLGCPVGAQVDLLSSAFAPSRHEFAGVPTAYSKVRRNGSFSARAAIPARRHQGVYVVSGRCGGGNLGVSTRLRVR